MGAEAISRKLKDWNKKVEEKRKMIWDCTLLILVCAYTAFPDYFRVSVVPVYSIVIMLAAMIAIFVCKVPVRLSEGLKKYWRIFAGFAAVEIFCMLAHKEWITAGRYFLEHVFIIVLVYLMVNTKARFLLAVKALVITAGILSVSGLVEYFLHFNIFSLIDTYSYNLASFGSASYGRLGAPRIEQSMNHAISYCVYLLFSTCLTYYLYSIQTEKRKKYFYIGILVFITINVFMTQSRACMMMDLFVLFLFIVMACKKRANAKLKWILIGFAAAVISFLAVCWIFIIPLPAALGKYVYLFPSLFSKRYDSYFSSLGLVIDNPFPYRLFLFSAVGEKLEGNWLLGIGLKNMEAVKFLYDDPNSGYTLTLNSIDNAYLAQILKYGVLGLVAYLIYYGYLVYQSVSAVLVCRKKNPHKEVRAFVFYFACLAAAYMVLLFTAPQMHEYRLFYVVIALFLRDFEWDGIPVSLSLDRVRR